MSGRILFGTDGIRGKANAYPLDPQTVVKIGQAAGKIPEDNGWPKRSETDPTGNLDLTGLGLSHTGENATPPW